MLDSGNRREFDTGAVRDIQEGKGRCDLLPLDIVGAILNDPVLVYIDNYIRTGEINELISIFEIVGYHTKVSNILSVSIHYEEGLKKYGVRNWEKGIPLSSYIDSAVRHYLKTIRGDVDEEHYRAFIWNILCCMWTHKHIPEMIDLPFKE